MKTTAFIGTGRMAAALISCICKSSVSRNIIASDKNNINLARIKKQFKIKTTTDNKEAARNSDIVFICVKPQDIDAVLDEIKDVVKNQLIVSIAAGIRLKHLENKLKNKRIIRVMPNINCIAGEMAAGFSAGKYATKEDIKNVSGILNSAGIAFFMKEDLLDAVTGISGSGPAFFAYFIDAFVKAGVKNGLPRETAFKLACQTALGTGRLLMEKNLSPDKLIAMVASKKGTTVAGLDVLKKHKAKNILIKTKNKALIAIAKALKNNSNAILQANKKDVEKAEKSGLGQVLIKRLMLDKHKISEMAEEARSVARLEEPVGRVLSQVELDKGLMLYQVACPIGVIGAIFESRPDAVVQISALCLKSGNSVILKGGSEAKNSNRILVGIISKAAEKNGIPKGSVQLIETREQVAEMLNLDDCISLVIPRGSGSFVKYVQEHTKIPVLGHSEGICHVYVDKYADMKKA